MRPLEPSPLCGRCRQLARGRLTEIKRLDGQPWKRHVRRWWLINAPGLPPNGTSSALGLKVLANVTKLLHGVESSIINAPERSCTIEGPLDPILHHAASSLPSPTACLDGHTSSTVDHSVTSLSWQNGCHLCSRRMPKTYTSPEDRATEYTQCIVLVKEKQPLPNARILKLVFVYVDQNISYLDRASVSLDIFEKEEISFRGAGRRTEGLSADFIARIRGWLDDCSHKPEHEDCRRSLSAAVGGAPANPPSRLMRIENRNGTIWIRLQERHQFPKCDGLVPYVTLSYHWGKRNAPWVLTQTRYHETCSGVPVDVLPAAFQDAIKVTLLIGITYIWIDALCIIQDLKQDWMHESPRMAAVYSQATLCISATHAQDVSRGLFVQQKQPARGTVHIHWSNTDIPEGSWAIGGLRYWDKYSTAPLNCRGWVYQETLLSPRILHFAADEIWMQCRKSIGSESSTFAMYQAYKSQRSRRLSSVQFPYELLQNRDWVMLVRNFTHCDLSKWEDRLVAVSGIAEAFSNMHGLPPADYHAGIWKSEAVEHLLWRANPEHRHRKVIKPYVAPTWSWASTYTWTHFLWSKIRNRFTPSNSNFEILDIATTLAGSNPFGPVKDGHLDIRAFVHTIVIDHDEAHLRGHHPRPAPLRLTIGSSEGRQSVYPEDELICLPTHHEEAFTVYFDEEAVAQRSKPFRGYIVPVRRSLDVDAARWYRDLLECFVLRKTGQRGVFVRAGLLRVGSAVKFSELPWWWTQGTSIEEDRFLDHYHDETYKFRIV